MANYVKITDFAVKDTLLSGNPLKLIRGSEIDTEFNNLATAIATKLDVDDIGVTIQAYSANLVTYATRAPTTAGLDMVSAANAAAQRALLNVGALDTANTWTGVNTFQKPTIEAGADMASAATMDFTAATGNMVRITGTAETTSVTMNNGQRMVCFALDTWRLKHHATNLPLPGSADYICQAGDVVIISKDNAGGIHVEIARIDGQAVSGRVGGGWGNAIFGYGFFGSNSYTNVTNLVSNAGVVSSDQSGVGTARVSPGAASYGGDRAIFGYGRTAHTPHDAHTNVTNLVSNTGVVSSDQSGVGTARVGPGAASYGRDRAIFGYGWNGSPLTITNLVSNVGVVSTDQAGVGTARYSLAAAPYGGDRAIFGYGLTSHWTLHLYTNVTNLVSNTGVVSSDQSGVGTARAALGAASYGGDRAIFGYGQYGSGALTNVTNLVSNVGVVSTDQAGVGTARWGIAAGSFGGDRAIFGYGNNGGSDVSMTNLVSNTGVVSTDQAGVGTARWGTAVGSFGN